MLSAKHSIENLYSYLVGIQKILVKIKLKT